MKTLTILLAILLCFGCATPPKPPNSTQMVLDILNHRGMTAEQINQAYADYDKARAEYEQTASYKSIPYLLAPLLLLGSAANGLPFGPGSYGYGYRGTGKMVINSTPTAGGGYRTTIDPMY